MKAFVATWVILSILGSLPAFASETPFDENAPVVSQPKPATQPAEEIRAIQAQTADSPNTSVGGAVNSEATLSSSNTTAEGPASLTRPNAFTVELLGRAGVWSLSYDRSVTSWLSLGAGLSYIGFVIGPLMVGALVFPVFANFYILPDQHRPYLTVGTDFALAVAANSWSEDSSARGAFTGFNNFHAGIGYEYRSASSGFLFRVGPYVMAMTNGVNWLVFPTLGLSLGGAF